MKQFSEALSSQSGVAPLLLVFVISLFFVGALYGADVGYVKYSQQQLQVPATTPVAGEPSVPVTARGSITKKNYTVDIEMNFDLAGGTVTGKFSGACDGTLSGTYDGKDGGVINGKAAGSCDPFYVPIPASGTFAGTVNKQQKVVSISGTGTAGGFSGEGSLSLSF